MKKTIFLFSCLGLTVFANESNIQQYKEQNFNKIKQMEEKSHQERINILKNADDCIKNARSKEEYKPCELKEQQLRKDSNQNIKMERQQFQQDRQKQNEQMFKERKQQHVQKLKEMTNCIEQAQTPEMLKQCRPQKDKNQLMNNQK